MALYHLAMQTLWYRMVHQRSHHYLKLCRFGPVWLALHHCWHDSLGLVRGSECSTIGKHLGNCGWQTCRWPIFRWAGRFFRGNQRWSTFRLSLSDRLCIVVPKSRKIGDCSIKLVEAMAMGEGVIDVIRWCWQFVCFDMIMKSCFFVLTSLFTLSNMFKLVCSIHAILVYAIYTSSTTTNNNNYYC